MPPAFKMRRRLVIGAGLLLALPAQGATLRAVTAAQLRDDTAAMRGLAAACAANASACDGAKVVGDEQVGDAAKPGGYTQHWYWLRTAMDEAAKLSGTDRGALMRDAQQRLEEIARQSKAPPAAPGAYASARGHVDAVLNRPEFHAVTSPSWIDRLWAAIAAGIDRIFEGVGQFGSASPWLAPLLEWGFFLAAAAGLGFFVLRALARQRMQVKLSEGAAAASVWDRESTDWARHADERAAAGDWREALHGLYWAAILHLESRRAWRHDPSRTPREYVRLLPSGSVGREALAGLTRVFERVWYGLEDSTAEEYRAARALYDRITRATQAQAAGAPAAAALGAA